VQPRVIAIKQRRLSQVRKHGLGQMQSIAVHRKRSARKREREREREGGREGGEKGGTGVAGVSRAIRKNRSLPRRVSAAKIRIITI